MLSWWSSRFGMKRLPHAHGAKFGVVGGLCVLAVMIVAGPSTAARSEPDGQAGTPQHTTPLAQPSSPVLTPGHRLNWHPVTPPSALGDPRAIFYGVAASDMDTAYACAIQPHQIFVTHNAGRSWMPAGTLPWPEDAGNWYVSFCDILVDQTDANTTLVMLSTVHPHGKTHDYTFVTRDGGKTWALSELDHFFNEIASFHGTTYALRDLGTLVASTDGLKTWHSAEDTLPHYYPGGVDAFWLNPSTGELLAQTWVTKVNTALFTSSDGGQSWQRLASSGVEPMSVVVSWPPSGGAPRICVAQQTGPATDPTANSGPNVLACTNDGGHTWTRRPTLNVSLLIPEEIHSSVLCGIGAPCPTPVPRHPTIQPLQLVAIDAHGAVLAAVRDAVVKQDHWYQINSSLYRLEPGATNWQSLGPLPQSEATQDYSTPTVLLGASGQLWTMHGFTPFPAGYGDQPSYKGQAVGAAVALYP